MTGLSYSDGEQTADYLGDQACRPLADTVHRQGSCRHACGEAAKGPSDSDCVEDSGTEPQTMEEILESIQRNLAECAADPAPQLPWQIEDQTVEVVTTPTGALFKAHNSKSSTCTSSWSCHVVEVMD